MREIPTSHRWMPVRIGPEPSSGLKKVAALTRSNQHNPKPCAREPGELDRPETLAQNKPGQNDGACRVQRGQCRRDRQDTVARGKNVKYVCHDVERDTEQNQPNRGAPDA